MANTLHELDPGWFDLVLATNLRGPFLCMRRQIPAMLAGGGGMARAALFLLSDESRWTTGTVLPCEGGRASG